MQKSLSRLILAIALAILWDQAAHATVIQTPAGLNPGDQFQIIFVTTGTRDGTSTVIGDYDAFVNADAGSVTYNGLPVTFRAIGSTETVHAKDHIGQFSILVYLNDGISKVTNHTTAGMTGGIWSKDFVDTVHLLHSINQALDGTPRNTTVWSGTHEFGLASAHPLGTSTPSRGFTIQDGGGWITYITKPSSTLESMYGISPVLTVPVPEPGSVILLGLGAVSLFAVARRRRQQTY